MLVSLLTMFAPVFTYCNLSLIILIPHSSSPDDDGPTALAYCLFTAERMTFSTAEARCKAYSDSNSRTCDFKNVYTGYIKPSPDEKRCSSQGMDRGNDWHWTDKSCEILVKGKPLFAHHVISLIIFFHSKTHF